MEIPILTWIDLDLDGEDGECEWESALDRGEIERTFFRKIAGRTEYKSYSLHSMYLTQLKGYIKERKAYDLAVHSIRYI